MISPQSIAVAAAAGHLVGKESELFRFTVKHSFIMLIFICCIVFAQAYLFSWIIPEYQMLAPNTVTAITDFSRGYAYLFVLVFVLVAFALLIILMTRNKVSRPKISTLTVTK
jgi:lactate permease